MSAWTLAELDAAIADTKASIRKSVALRGSEQRGRDGGTTGSQFRPLDELRKHLNYLEGERAALTGSSGLRTAPMIPGRGPY